MSDHSSSRHGPPGRQLQRRGRGLEDLLTRPRQPSEEWLSLPLLLRDEVEVPVLRPIIRGMHNDPIFHDSKPWTIAASASQAPRTRRSRRFYEQGHILAICRQHPVVSEVTDAQWMPVSSHIETSAFGAGLWGWGGGGVIFLSPSTPHSEQHKRSISCGKLLAKADDGVARKMCYGSTP